MKRIGQVCVSAILGLGALTVMPQTAKADWFSCTPTEIIEWTDGLHVRCSNSITLSGNVVQYIKISFSSTERARRFLSLATSALVSSRVFLVEIPASSATNVAGCQASNCRTPTVFGVRN